ncbi:uncharacterized protein LOC143037697 isoform X2 [Oratosquilla oratoria]|uniref:uncharacterized protein LOC143037697 isoform X2 n=1 Tax=Oratosquilla oratoria TaxID=337810 RepID=UPI003F75811E
MDDEKLVLAVQRQSAIYDKRNPKHRNRDALRMMWNECAAELGTDNGNEILKSLIRKLLASDMAKSWLHNYEMELIDLRRGGVIFETTS